MGSFFGGGGNTTATSNQTNAPWAPTQGTLLDAMNSATNLYNQGTPQIYSGQYLPTQSAQTQGAIGGITDLTNSGVLQNLISGAQGTAQNISTGANQGGGNAYLQSLLSGTGGTANQFASQTLPSQLGTGNTAQAQAQSVLGNLASGQNLAQNPYLNSMYASATQPMINQYESQIAPGINAQFSAAGRYGGANTPGSALATAQGNAEQTLGTALGTTAANLYGNAYNTNVAQQTNAMDTLANLGTTQTGQQLNYGTLLSQLQGQNTTAAQALNAQQISQGGLQLNAANSIPALANAAYSPYQQLGAAGQTMDQYNTQNQQYQEQLYNYLNGGGAWQTLSNYTNLLGANPATRATSTAGTQTQMAPTSSGFGSAVSDIASVAGLIAML